MRSTSEKAGHASGRVRTHFHRKAFSFDRLYDEDHLVQRVLRPGLLRRRELALSVVREYHAPRVLDVGCGPGRIGEAVLDAGAAFYVGVDFSEPMIALARERLARHRGRVELVTADILEARLAERFDVVLALGVFDYLPDAAPYARRIAELCRGSAVASFPRWNWLKGPIRKVRYELLNDCPIFDYAEEELRSLFAGAGFARVDVAEIGRTGYLVRADRRDDEPG